MKVVILCAQVMTPFVTVCKVLLCPLGIHGTWTIIGSSLGNMFSICSFALCSLVSVTCHIGLTTYQCIQHQTMTLNSLGSTCDVESNICIGSINHNLSSHFTHNLNWGKRLLFMHELVFVHHNLIHDNSPRLKGKTQGIKHGIGHTITFTLSSNPSMLSAISVQVVCKEHIIIGSVTRIGCILCLLWVVLCLVLLVISLWIGLCLVCNVLFIGP